MYLSAACELLGINEETESLTSGVFVANQGNFTDGNGSVTVYNPQTQDVVSNAISDLGSIVQSIFLLDDRLFVLSNTGERIDIFNTTSNEQMAQITDIISPRYMVKAASNKAYVTNLFNASGSFSGGKVSVIDVSTNTKTREIDVGNNPEGITYANGNLFVANHGFGAGNTVTVIDTSTDEVVNTIDVECDGPRLVFTDQDQEVFVFCTGQTMFDENWNVIGESNGAVRILNSSTGAIEARFDIDGRISTMGPGQDVFLDADRKEAYVVIDNNSLLRIDTETNQQSDLLGPFEGDPIGAVGYDVIEDRIYIGRVPGFTESGTVTIHDRDGVKVGEFSAGIAPTYITFHRETR